jgi:hypothetical protein
MLQREAPLAGVLFSFRSSTNLHDVLAREDVLSSGASVEENHHGNQEEETEEIGYLFCLADKLAGRCHAGRGRRSEE